MRKTIGVINTSGHLQCRVEQAWEKICFYERITLQPSWLLRTVLPVPVQTTGAYRRVGDISRCVYSDGGFLTKRITRVLAGESIEFAVIEQSIRYSSWIGLLGGSIRVVACDDGTCWVHMQTRYSLPSWLFGAFRGCLGMVVRAMHEIVIRDMRYRLSQAHMVVNIRGPLRSPGAT